MKSPVSHFLRSMARNFKYWECCIGLPGEIVRYLVDHDRTERIRYTTFSRHADLEQMRADEHPATYRMSCKDNWAISFWRSRLPSGKLVYYFDWSRIEHVFVDSGVNLERELALLEGGP